MDQYNYLTLTGMHLRVLFWAVATMSSMGYSNAPRPIADIDYAYAISTQVVGACMAAAIFSNIAQLINKGDAAAARYQSKLDQIREFSRLSAPAPASDLSLLLPALSTHTPRAPHPRVRMAQTSCGRRCGRS